MPGTPKPQPYPDLIARGIYRHYRNGDLFEVTGFAKDAMSGEGLVLFRHHPPRVYLPTLSRPLTHFQDFIGHQRRFTQELRWKRWLVMTMNAPAYAGLQCGHKKFFRPEDLDEFAKAGMPPLYFLCDGCGDR